MKKRKGSLLRRMMAVLLSVVLVAGMVSNAALMTVLAQEPDGQQESGVSGQETVSGNEPGTGEGAPDSGEGGSGTGEDPSGDAEEETQDTVSGNDIELPVKKANGKARMPAQSASGEITSDTTWTGGSTVSEATIKGGSSEQSAVVITVEGSVTVTGTITVSSGYVRFTGGGSLNWQAASISNAVIVEAEANAIFENVTLDGSKGNQFKRSALLFQGTVTLGNKVRVQNFSSDTGSGASAGYKGVIAVYGKGSLTVTEGVTITGNRSTSGIIAIYQSDTGGGESTASVTMSGGTIEGNTVGNSNLGVIWNWCGKLNISGGTVTAAGNEYAVHTQGNAGNYDATTVIMGGAFIGNILGAVCAGKDSTNNSRITIKGGIFTGKTAATVNYGVINIEGGSFTGTTYALQTLNTGAALNVAGGEFYGGTKAYSGNVTTATDKVIVGTGRESAANWDKKTNLNTYQYVAIGEFTEQPGDDGKRDVNFKIKIYGYQEGYPLNFENVGVIWEGNTNNPVMGEVLEKGKAKDGYYLWEYVFKGLDTGRKYGIKNGNTPGQIGEISETGTAFEKTVYAVNYYDGDTLAQIMYMESGKTVGRAWKPPAKDGYTFSGWMTQKEGSEAFDFERKQITQVTDVYASWTLNAPPHEHDGITFTAWTATDNLPTAAGNYYLTENVTLTKTWNVPSGKTILCLNGKTIRGSSEGSVIKIAESAALNLYDCKNNGNITGGKYGVYNDGTFCMYGGKISDNKGVCGVAFEKGTFTVGGDAVISGNTDDGKTYYNVYLEDGQTIRVDSDKPLSGSASIGVTTQTKPKDGNPVNVTGHNKGDCSRYFHSDNPAYEIVNANDVVQLTVKAQTYAVTVHNGTGDGDYKAGDTVTITANAAASGKQFDKWVVNSGSVTLASTTSSATTFIMPAGAVEVTATYKDITEEHTHNYGKWRHDDTQHWKVCSCGNETGRGNHDFGNWITDKEATAVEAGTKHRDCQICGYRQTGTIPATGTDPGSGTVTPEVKPGANVPATNISTPTEELKYMLLTDDDKQKVQKGTNIRIVLEVQDAGNSVDASDQAAVSQALNGYAEGQYLNIELYKLVGAARTDITETAKKIRIIITVPDSLKNADSSKTRTFAVIRVHTGSAELLTDLDGSADTITIETDRFSTYAIVYKDTANSGNNDNHGSDNGNDNSSSNNNSQNNSDKKDAKPDSTKDDEPKTGDNTPLELFATLTMIAGFAYLLLYFTDRRRGMTEETKKELVSRLIGWAKRGGKIRKYLAIAAVFVLLVLLPQHR